MTTNAVIKFATVYGQITLATETAEVALAVFGNDDAMAKAFAGDVRNVRAGLDVEKLREKCCDGAVPGSAEDIGWSDWADAVAVVAEMTDMYPVIVNEVE